MFYVLWQNKITNWPRQIQRKKYKLTTRQEINFVKYLNIVPVITEEEYTL